MALNMKAERKLKIPTSLKDHHLFFISSGESKENCKVIKLIF